MILDFSIKKISTSDQLLIRSKISHIRSCNDELINFRSNVSNMRSKLI